MKIPVYFYLFVGVIALGCSAILIRLADAEPLAIAAYRMCGAALLLLPFTGQSAIGVWKALSSKEKIIWAGFRYIFGVSFCVLDRIAVTYICSEFRRACDDQPHIRRYRRNFPVR